MVDVVAASEEHGPERPMMNVLILGIFEILRSL